MPRDRENFLRWSRENYRKNRDRILAGRRNSDGTRKARIIEYGQRYSKGWHLKRAYGLSIGEFEAMAKEQSGLCAICLQTMKPGKGTHVDHCHKTGKIRSLLCQKCNRGIGHFNDNVLLLEAAANYIRRHNGE